MNPPVAVPVPTAGSALLAAAAAAGHGARARALLEGGWSESARTDGELMLWAADYGAFPLIHNRLDEYTTAPMLRIARAWLGLDPAAELRRRLGDAHATVQRRRLPIDEYDHVECVRVTAADGRWAEVQTAHPAIVTYIEEHLGRGASRDELMARALAGRDPGSVNWSQAVFAVQDRRNAEETLRWALDVLTAPDPDARRFAAEVVHSLSIDQAPCPDGTLAAVRDRLTTEPDPVVLISLIGAAGEYHGPGTRPEIVAHAGHPDPAVRRAVTGSLCYALMEPESVPEGAVVLARLAADRDARVRAAALSVLRDYAFDHPVTGRLLIAGRDDPDLAVRVEALAGLARGGDAGAYRDLRRLADAAGVDSPLSMAADAAAAWLRKATTPDTSTETPC